MKDKLLGISISTIIALVVVISLIVFSGADPTRAVNAFINGVFGNLNGTMEVFVKATPIILTSLGIAISFRTGFFNIGGEGQFYMGALAGAVAALKLTALPGPIHIVICLLCGVIAGGSWALLASLMKIKLNISETVTTIMLNYVALMIVGVLIRGPLQEDGSALPQTAAVSESCRLLKLLPPTRLHFGIIIAIIASLLLWFLLEHTTLGYEFRMTGSNSRAAECLGLPVARSQILSSFLGGGLVGVAGVCELLGVQNRLLEGLSADVGYTAILIALLSGNRPLAVLAVSLVYAFFQTGANSMQRMVGVPSALVQIITGMIVIMLLSRTVFDRIRISRRKTVS